MPSSSAVTSPTRPTREEEVDNESRGRQLIGAANIEGGPLFHMISGNPGLSGRTPPFPDMPSSRYSEIAPKVKDICERYAVPYNSGRLFKKFLADPPHQVSI